MARDLLLSSGWLAFASHCGVLAAFEEADEPIEGVGGTSSGALVGALWSAGLSAREALDVLCGRRPLAWIRPHAAVWRGLFRLDAMLDELRRHLPARFDQLPRPFGVGVATLDRSPKLITEGPLAEAVVASCAVPRLFTPVMLEGVPYVDGGAADRIGLLGWRAVRPQAPPPWIHLVARTAGSPVDTDLTGCRVVRSPRSGAQLWSLGDVDARFQRARAATLAALE